MGDKFKQLKDNLESIKKNEKWGIFWLGVVVGMLLSTIELLILKYFFS